MNLKRASVWVMVLREVKYDAYNDESTEEFVSSSSLSCFNCCSINIMCYMLCGIVSFEYNS